MGGLEVRPGDLKPIRKLGEGAFAVVEEAHFRPTSTGMEPASPSGAGRRVAVKRLKPEIVKHKGDLEAFLKEISLLRKLANKRVVDFIGVGSSDPSTEETRRATMFLVQEYMDGGTLKKLVSKQMMDMGRHLYTYGDAFRWVLQISEGLEYLHGAQPVVIHRDLKLENLLLKGTDPHTADVKISDFGLVALVPPRQRGLYETLQAADQAAVIRLSGSKSGFKRLMSMRRKKCLTVQELWDQSFKLAQVANSTVRSAPPQQLSGRTGSYMYMAPEMYKQQEYNEKVDVFSFGVIMFELLSRYQTVCSISVAGTEAEIESYAAKVADGYRPPLPDAWPETVRELIARCWHQEPDQRPSMPWVRERLSQMTLAGVPLEMETRLQPPGCGCAIM